MKKYNHNQIEKKWQRYWEQKKAFLTKDNAKGPKKYILDMFPYPSGAGLHVGHPEGYTTTDIVSRYSRMNGFNVLHPMGWDAFGLPAENYAIKMGVHPQKTTQKNIKRFTSQIKSIGLSYDWTRELNTSDPEYYKWTQWLFLELYKKGLAYKKLASVNWCPKDNTVLANEQVVDGKCERCGTEVIQKKLSQWFFKITDYADELLSEINKLDWPEPIKLMQRNWIGKSQGVSWQQKIKDLNISVECYDSVPQTFMAQTFCVIAPEHPLLKKLVEGTEYQAKAEKFVIDFQERKAADKFKVENEIEGMFTGRYIDNPFGTGDLPIWIASFVVTDYGSGIVNCSAHDERDFDFAKKFNIPLRPVMFPGNPVEAEKVKNLEYCYHHDPEAVMQQPVEFKGRKWGEAREDIIDFVEKKGIGKRATNYKIRDWLVSRQRYWGAPIPIVYCKNCATENKKFLIFHGWQENPETRFYPWLKQELIKRGIEALVPQLPNSSNPTEKEQVDFILKNYKFDQDSVLVAHSLGGVTAMKVIEKLPNKISGLILVGGFVNPKFKDHPRPFEKDFNWKFNFKKIKDRVDSITILHDPSDDAIAEAQAEELSQAFGVPVTRRHGKLSHFRSEEEVEVLNVCLPFLAKDPNAGMFPLSEKDLPLKLPTDVDFRPTGESPLKRSKKFGKVKCPKCGGKAERDYDTMDTFVDSSWYFLRYTDNKNEKAFADKKKIQKWAPVDMYVGGAEHAVLHLLYARFITKVLRDLGYLNFGEPFLALKNQGLILGPDGEKMSKSRGNVINPDDVVKESGADSLRMYEMFMGPFEDAKPWQTNGIIGVKRFLERVYSWVNQNLEVRGKRQESEKAKRELHKLIKKVTEDIETFHFNTSISAFMQFHNDIKDESVSKEFIKTFLTLLYPFAPHISEELNSVMGGKKSLQFEKWPKFDPALVIDNEIEIIVQVNGKVKGKIIIARASSEESVKTAALQIDAVKQTLGTQAIKRVINVPNRLINFVI